MVLYTVAWPAYTREQRLVRQARADALVSEERLARAQQPACVRHAAGAHDGRSVGTNVQRGSNSAAREQGGAQPGRARVRKHLRSLPRSVEELRGVQSGRASWCC